MTNATLPTLAGQSDKQVSYATDVRARQIEAAMLAAERSYGATGIAPDAQMHAATVAAIEHLAATETSARWWLDSRTGRCAFSASVASTRRALRTQEA